MASPAVRSATSGNSGGNATSTTITYPATIEAGDVLVMFVGGDGNLGCSASGWTFTQIQDSGSGMSCIYGLKDAVAVGNEDGTTFSLTTNNESFGWTIYAISGAEFAGILSPQTVGGSSTGNPDPPSISPDASRDWLFLAAGGWDGNRSLSSYPTNYSATNSQQTNRVAASTGGGVASAGRQLTTGSAENPGVFTISTADEWAAITVAIPPAIPKTNANAGLATATGAALDPSARYWVRANAGLATAVGVAYGGGGGSGTTQKSWPWATTNEGFTHTGTGHGAYQSGEGNPAGSLYFYVDYGTLWFDDWFTLSGITWEDLGVPSGSTVTRARLNTGQHYWQGVQGECGLDVALQDGSGNHLAYVLQDTPGANDVTWTSYLTQSWMDFGDQSSNSGMRVVLHAYANTGAGGDGTLVGNLDNLAIDIEYVSGGGMVRVATFAPLAQATGAALTATVETQAGVPQTNAQAELATASGSALTASVAKFENVRVNAGLATATGAALGPGARPEKLAAAELATASGSALTASAAHFENVRANAGLATATGSALGAPASEGAIAPVAGAQGSALAPVASINAFASTATATGEGLTATVQTTGAEPVWHPWSATWSNTVSAGTAAPAGLATAAGAALEPTVAVMENVRPSAELATATGAALAPTASEGAVAGQAAATGAALDASVTTSSSVSAQAELATATGAALAPVASVGAPAGLAASTAAALAPSARPERRVDAQTATATGAALGPSVAEEAHAGLAAATGAALDATVTTSASVSAQAERAQATGAALDPSAAIMENVRPVAGLATATGLALTAAGVGERRVAAGLASATGAALAPKVWLGAIAVTAAATGAALDASVTTNESTSANAERAQATGAAYPPAVHISTWTGTATATGAALAPSVRVYAFAPTATAVGAALQPQGLASKFAAAGLATATGAALAPGKRIGATAELASALGAALVAYAYAGEPGRVGLHTAPATEEALPGARVSEAVDVDNSVGMSMNPGSTL